MSKAHVVIGANYGDEGKGLIADYLVHKHKADMVVRFNGGAQAGHTVVTPDGKRHVFKHFGSGTFECVRTFLSKHFVANPMIFLKELAALESMGVHPPKVMIDPRAYVSTPYDMIVNEVREKHFKHGSCGLGVTDTVDRNQSIICNKHLFTLSADDVHYNAIYNNEQLHYKLQLIRQEWVPIRLKELNIPYTHEIMTRVMDDKLMWKFLEDLVTFGKTIGIMNTKSLSKHDSLIFEGGQGLGLDQVQGTVPHVTKSFTGMTNVVDICKEANIEHVNVYYVTRAYLTRHGAGPMESELKEKPYKGIKEMTNVTNEFQGKFRYGNLNVRSMRDRIRTDLRGCGDALNITIKLAVTCIDQVDEKGRFVNNNLVLKRVDRDNMAMMIAREAGFMWAIESRGPTRDDVREILAL